MIDPTHQSQLPQNPRRSQQALYSYQIPQAQSPPIKYLNHRNQAVQQLASQAELASFGRRTQTNSDRRSFQPELSRLMNKPIYQPMEGGRIEEMYIGNQRRHVSSSPFAQGHVSGYQAPYPPRQQIPAPHLQRAISRQLPDRVSEQDYKRNYEHRYHESQSLPKATSRLEYIPYTKKYYELQQREVVNVVYVPVEKVKQDFYTVQTVIQYEAVPYEETIVEYVPEERINYKVQYQFVEKKIIHMPVASNAEDLKYLKEEDRVEYMQQQGMEQYPKSGYQGQLAEEQSWRPTTHYVTSNVPSYKIQLRSEQDFRGSRHYGHQSNESSVAKRNLNSDNQIESQHSLRNIQNNRNQKEELVNYQQNHSQFTLNKKDSDKFGFNVDGNDSQKFL